MLWTIFVILLIAWVLGLVGVYQIGAFVWLLLVAAFIAYLLVEGKVYLAPRTLDEEYQPPFNADQIGYYDSGADQKMIYLRTETSLARAKEYWRGLDENLDIMPDALRRQLRQVDGLLAQVGERQVEASKSCRGIKQRVLVVDIHKVEQMYGVSLARPEK